MNVSTLWILFAGLMLAGVFALALLLAALLGWGLRWAELRHADRVEVQP